MADPNPLAGMPLAESLANNMNESLQWMARMWGKPGSGFRRPAPNRCSGLNRRCPGGHAFDADADARSEGARKADHRPAHGRALARHEPRVLHSTIQTLEMQRNAIVALQSMARSAQAGPSVASTGNVGPRSGRPGARRPPGGRPAAGL